MKTYSASIKRPILQKSEVNSLRTELSALPTDDKHYGLIHYDFEPDNVFYDESTETCSVIDFDDGMYHRYALDVEQALSCVAEELDSERFEAAKTAFINGYKTEYEFDENSEKLLPLMRRFVNLFAYARLIRCVDEKFSNEPDWLIGLREKLDGKIKRLENEISQTNK